ncbi:MAG: hypothetical protein R3D55_28010 [Chloroflexota bacterium]
MERRGTLLLLLLLGFVHCPRGGVASFCNGITRRPDFTGMNCLSPFPPPCRTRRHHITNIVPAAAEPPALSHFLGKLPLSDLNPPGIAGDSIPEYKFIINEDNTGDTRMGRYPDCFPLWMKQSKSPIQTTRQLPMARIAMVLPASP